MTKFKHPDQYTRMRPVVVSACHDDVAWIGHNYSDELLPVFRRPRGKVLLMSDAGGWEWVDEATGKDSA